MAKRSRADVKHAIDLLWSHQIRRENAALHKEVKRLQDEVTSHNDEVVELRAVSEKAKTAAETAIACVQKALADQTPLQTAVEDAHQQVQYATEKVTSLEKSLQDGHAKQTETITHFNQDIDKLRADLTRFQEQHQLEFNQADASIQHISMALENKWEVSELADLQNRIDHIEDFLQYGQNVQSVSRIEDSVGNQQCGGYVNETNPLLTLEKSPEALGQPRPHGEHKEAEPMLTFRDANERGESMDVDEIDLDENVTTMSYAKHIDRDGPIPDSLALLPQQESYFTQANALQPLNQGRFHSWDRYVTEGQTLVKKRPRKQEFDIVKSFVAGLYSTKQREQCEQWLDVSGWTWESVAAFGLSSTPSVPVHLDSIVTRAKDKGNANSGQAKTASTPNLASASTDQPKKVMKVPIGKLNVETRSSQRLREQKQAAKHADKPQEMKKTKSTAKLGRSQTALNKTATSPRNAKRRVRHRRSSSPVLAANPSQPGVRHTIAEERKLASRQRAKPGGQAASTKHSKARAPKQQATAVPSAPDVSTRVKPIQELPERPGTPPSQQTPSQSREQTVPRLVKRKRSVDRICEEQGRKRKRLMVEEELPPLPALAVQGVGRKESRKWKGRRLPLPPPPEIPIMPTSDD